MGTDSAGIDALVQGAVFAAGEEARPAHGNPASRSDLEVGARALDAGIWGCYRNVLINAASLADATLRERVETEARALAGRAAARLKDVMAALDARG